MCCKDVETEEITLPPPPPTTPTASACGVMDPFKCRVACLFQATSMNASSPTVVIDVKPKVLITNNTDNELLVDTNGCVVQLKAGDTNALLNFKVIGIL